MKDNQHIVTAFDDDLSELNISLQNLGKMAITQFELSIDALATQHQNTLDKIIKDDVKLCCHRHRDKEFLNVLIGNFNADRHGHNNIASI